MNYIDGFVFPIATTHLETYKQAAEKIANIWKEHGALSYNEYVMDPSKMEGTLAFPDLMGTTLSETIIFGYVVFESKASCVLAHEKVSSDSRMQALVAPLMDPQRLIFDAARMAYGRFQSLIEK